MSKTYPGTLPSKADILKFIQESPTPVGKREIARAFRIKGAARIELKALLAELTEAGKLEKSERKTFGISGHHLPPITVVHIDGQDDDGSLLASPAGWKHDAPPPRIRIAPGKGDAAVTSGDRALARLSKTGTDPDYPFEARIIRKLHAAKATLGVFRKSDEGGWVEPASKKSDRSMTVPPGETQDAEDGELVQVKFTGRRSAGRPIVRVLERLGDVTAPRSISLIAIHEHDLPFDFPDEVLAEADAARQITTLKGREDMRALPFVTIDPPDARDHDDALFAQADNDARNPGGWIISVAIADVGSFVCPGTALDREARKRGNSAYFPDRVVPMLPDRLSGDLCSLQEGVDRPVMVCRIVLDASGRKTSHRFYRALIRSTASLSYEQAQAGFEDRPDAQTAPLMSQVLSPLYAAWKAAWQARQSRAPLELDLPERKVEINQAGKVTGIHLGERFDAHKLVEEFMILANVCAAETLEEYRQPLLYRVHEEPGEEKTDALRETLKSVGIPLARGQRIEPRHFNDALKKVRNTEHAETVNMAVLRAQTQAYYSPENFGHFGLNLNRYAHFTSPIRRYADLIVHRALITAHQMPGQKKQGLPPEVAGGLAKTAEHISNTERRAMLAERDSTDRYLAAYLKERVGASFEGVISGIARFGLFVKLDETGADGLVPISQLGDDFYDFDPGTGSLKGRRKGARFRMGQRVTVKLLEANPVSGGMLFQLLDAKGRPIGTGKARHKTAPRGKAASKPKLRREAIRKSRAARKKRRK